MKKKISLLLCMLICILSMTACGKKEPEYIITEEEAYNYAVEVAGYVTYMATNDTEAVDWDDDVLLGEKILAVLQEAIGETVTAATAYNFPYNVQVAAKNNFVNSLEEVGAITDVAKKSVSLSEDEAVVKLKAFGANREGEIEIMFELKAPKKITVSSVALNSNYSFGEKMEKAALNTLLGMGSVFVILILICILISLFSFIPKLMNRPKKANTSEQSMDNAIAQIVENEEENLTDDLELVAVIAAAIAASEGASSTDGFVVRSIRKSNVKKWQNA